MPPDRVYKMIHTEIHKLNAVLEADYAVRARAIEQQVYARKSSRRQAIVTMNRSRFCWMGLNRGTSTATVTMQIRCRLGW